MLRNRRGAPGRAGEVYIRLAIPPPLSPLGHEVAARRAGETPALWQHHRSSEARISNQCRDLSTLWRNGVTDNRESRLSNGDFQMRRMSALGRFPPIALQHSHTVQRISPKGIERQKPTRCSPSSQIPEWLKSGGKQPFDTCRNQCR